MHRWFSARLSLICCRPIVKGDNRTALSREEKFPSVIAVSQHPLLPDGCKSRTFIRPAANIFVRFKLPNFRTYFIDFYELYKRYVPTWIRYLSYPKRRVRKKFLYHLFYQKITHQGNMYKIRFRMTWYINLRKLRFSKNMQRERRKSCINHT